MREKIDAILIAGEMMLNAPEDLTEFIDNKEIRKSRTDQILTLISEEIEKVENPHLYFGSPHTEYDIESNRYHSVFENCRNKVLALLKEK